MLHSSILTCITNGSYLSAENIDVLKHISDNGNGYSDQTRGYLNIENGFTNALFHNDNDVDYDDHSVSKYDQ